MTPIRHRLPLLAALAASTALAAAPAIAQDARCPPLPAGSGLHWQQQAGDGFVVCRARDGERQVLGLMLTAKPTIKPLRRNRREEGHVGSHQVRWYQPDITDGGGEYKRVAVVELGEDRYAQVWIDPLSEDEWVVDARRLTIALVE